MEKYILLYICYARPCLLLSFFLLISHLKTCTCIRVVHMYITDQLHVYVCIHLQDIKHLRFARAHEMCLTLL